MWPSNISSHLQKCKCYHIFENVMKEISNQKNLIWRFRLTFCIKERRQISFVRELIPFSKQFFTIERGESRCGLWARAHLRTIENHRCVLNVSGKFYRLTSPNIFNDFFIFRNFSKMLEENVTSNTALRHVFLLIILLIIKN